MKPYTGIIISLVLLILLFGGLKAKYYADKPTDIEINITSIERDTNNTLIEINKTIKGSKPTIDTIKIKNESIDSLIPKEPLDSLTIKNVGDTISD